MCQASLGKVLRNLDDCVYPQQSKCIISINQPKKQSTTWAQHKWQILEEN